MVEQSGRAVGRLILVGAGPGDPDLITLRGAAAMASADVVLFDQLACEDLLHLAPERAERINVGKSGHDAPTRTQDEINALILEHALAGKTVVRLKGGDPFVFGRGGEEATVCVAAGVPYAVVPGVSSAIGALAYAGIPITDRRHAASFAVVTGHKDPSRPAEETRWAELGCAVDTLVILMGMRNLEVLLQKLLDGGRDPETPAAAVMNGTLASQRVVEAPLAQLAEAVRAAGLSAPAVVVVGEVVGLREKLAWWEETPLFAKRVLVTRTPAQAGEMARALRAAGAEPVLIPMIRLEPPRDTRLLDASLANLDAYDGLIFTSANAVRFFAARARKLGVARQFSGLSARVLCVGPQSAQAALEAGLAVHLTGTGRGDAEVLLAELIEVLPPSGKRFLMPRSDIGRDVIPDGLRAAGAEVDAVEAYRNLPAAVERDEFKRQLVTGDLDVLTFASPSSVRNFFSLLDEEAKQACSKLLIAAVGRTTARAIEREGLTPQVVPDQPGGAELVAALVEHVAARRT